MSSSGLKLRDTRELLANPEQSEEPKNLFQSSANTELETSVTRSSSNQSVSAKVVTSMSPSLAMANAEASPSSQDKDRASTEAATSQNTRKESEPVPKKRRLLEATENVEDNKLSEQQYPQKQNDTDDILAQACFVVGIDSDLADSVVEEPLPSPQAEINGEIHRFPEGYSYVRGVRPPPPGIQMPPRLRHPEELIIHRPIHPAFRPPSNGTYGVEVRPPYNQPYAVQHRVPIHPGERHQYYAIHHYRGRYPYPGPPGSIPPSHRPPVLRPMPPNGTHERYALIQHCPPGYPYDSQRFPRPTVQHANHPQSSPLPHDTRREPTELHQGSQVSSEIRPPHPRHQEISFRWPSPHDLSNPVAYPSEQLSPIIAHQQYPRTGPIPIQPKQHAGNNQAPPDDPRSSHSGAYDGHIPKILPGNHPPTRYPPQRSSPHELSCRNPFELPEPQVSQKTAQVPETTTVSSSQDRLCTKKPDVSLERDKSQDGDHPLLDNEKKQVEAKVMEVSQSIVTIDRSSNNSKSRRLKEPPTPCVELIPITIPSSDDKKTMAENIDKRKQDSLPQGRNSPKVRSMQSSGRQRKISHYEESSHNAHILAESACSEAGKLVKTKNLKKSLDSSPLQADEEGSNTKNESLNKIPKRSFRKRWLDKQDPPASKRQTKHINPKSSEEKIKNCTTQEISTESEKNEEKGSIITDNTKPITNHSNLKESFPFNKNSIEAEMKPIGPGQLHHLHSSSYQSQNRSASEPPTGSTIPPNSSQALSNRPASLPGANQQSRGVRVNDESQKTVKHSFTHKGKEDHKTDKDKDENDSAFIARLNLVLNDLISVPEATKLQHLTCPVDELLASLVRRRGAEPSEHPNPRQRLRKDFLVLVKLCMPPNLIEDWGWDKCTPEEILDELIKVTNNGVDSIIGNVKQMKDQQPPVPSHTTNPKVSHPSSHHPPPLLPSSATHRALPPPPQASPSHQSPTVQQPTVKHSIPFHHNTSPSSNHSYHPHYVANPALPSPHHVSPPLGHPPSASHHGDRSPHHTLPSHPPVSPSTHPSMLPRHPSLSPHGPVAHSPNHPALSPHHRLSGPSPSPLSPHHRLSGPSQSPLSPHHRLPGPSQSPLSPHPHLPHHTNQTSPSSHNPMSTNHHSLPPHHPLPLSSSHPPLSPHQPIPLPSSQPSLPHHHPVNQSSSNHHPEAWTSYHHTVNIYSRQTSISSTQSDTSVSNEDHADDEVFSPKAREPPSTIQRSQIKAQVHPSQQLHPREPTHEGASISNKVPRMPPAYPQPQDAYARSPNSAHPSQQIPLPVLQYSQQGYAPQMAPQATSTPQNTQTPSHYPEPQHPPRVHNPSHYPRGVYPQPYAYTYYHPSNPLHPPPHPVHPSYRPPYPPSNMPNYYPQTLPNHAYNPPMHPRNPTSHAPGRNPTSQSPVRLVAQPAGPLSNNDWHGAERVEVTDSTMKPTVLPH